MILNVEALGIQPRRLQWAMHACPMPCLSWMLIPRHGGSLCAAGDPEMLVRAVGDGRENRGTRAVAVVLSSQAQTSRAGSMALERAEIAPLHEHSRLELARGGRYRRTIPSRSRVATGPAAPVGLGRSGHHASMSARRRFARNRSRWVSLQHIDCQKITSCTRAQRVCSPRRAAKQLRSIRHRFERTVHQ